MATLQKIRDRGVLLVAVIGIALLAFILGDLLTSGNTLFAKSRDKAFVVDGKIVSTQEYANRITEWEEFQKMISGQSSLDEATTQQIKEAVYDQMVREIILDEQSSKIGLAVSKAELNDLVHGETISPLLQSLPFFLDPETGLFDREGLVQFIATVNSPTQGLQPEEVAMIQQYKSMWMFIENMVKYQRLQEKFTGLLSSAVLVNDVEAKSLFDLSNKSADIAYVVKNYFSVPDSTASVSDQEIKAFYDKNKSSFNMDVPLAKISYFTKQITPSEEDFAEVEKLANEAYEKLLDNESIASIVADYSDVPYRDIFISAESLDNSQQAFIESSSVSDVQAPVKEGNAYNIYKLVDKTVAPDSIHLRLMSIPDATVMGQDSIVTNFVDSIFNEIKGGKAFADVANSLNPQANGGDIGWARESDLYQVGAEFVKTVFNAPIGQPFKFKTPGQQMILQVEGRTAAVQKYKVATISIPVLVSEKTSNNIDNELNQLMNDPNFGKNFSEMASEKGHFVMPNTSVSANDFSLMNMPGTRQVVTWAVNEKKMGTVKKFDLSNTRIIARVDQVYPAGTVPLSELKSSIKNRLMNDKKAEVIIADLASKNISSLDEYAEVMASDIDTVKFVSFDTQNISGLGFEPTINAVSAFLPVNSISAPLKGNMGVYVTTVADRTASEDQYDAANFKNMIHSNNAYMLQMQSLETLKKKMKVEDNRYVFF